MSARRRVFSLFLAGTVVAMFATTAAQPQGLGADAQSAPLTATIPFDQAIKTGTFENGLRYFIRTTKKPEKRAELRLVVNVGSILEDDDQQGLAHLLEHMAFNGTKHFPKQETVTFLESLGMRFGPSVNAYTSFDETVYMLQVPTEKPDVLDRSFLILEDWAQGQTLDPAEIDKERGVVKEEWRLRRGAFARMQDKQFPVMLKGSRYAERIPIGKPEIIDTFKHERLKQFYQQWYRPDLMTVIAVGDFDPAAVEKMIKAHFETIPAAKSPKPRPTYPVPDQPGTLYAIATDPEATTASVSIYSKFDPRERGTVGAYRRRLVERLFGAMLGVRYSELAQKPDAPFVGAGTGRGTFVRTKEMTSLSAGVKGDQIDKTIDILFTEAERVARFGFTPGELERTKINILTSLERALVEKDNTPAASIAGELVGHVTNQEVVPGIAYEVTLSRRFLPEITLAEVNALAKDWLPDRNRVVTISAPEKTGFAVPNETQVAAVMAAVPKKEITAYVDTVDAAPLLDPLPKPGATVKEATKDAYGITEWQLANGVRVVLKPTTFKEDEILVRATSFGGSSHASDADYHPASSATAVLNAGGLGRFSLVDLRKKLTGKTASATAFISEYEEGLNGSSARKDVETMFQLIYLRFTQPRRDPEAFAAFQGQMRSALTNQRNSPNFHFNEAVSSALRSNHLRARPLTLEAVDALNLDKSVAFYKDRFADASDFTFVIVGSFEVNGIKPLVEQYLGALPSTGRKETWKDTGIRYANGVVERRVEKGVEPQSQTTMVFTGAFDDTQEERIAMRALGEVLQTRLRERLREDLGGTYSVGATPSYARIPVGQYSMTISFGSAPDRVEGLVKATLDQVELLKNEGPTEQQVADAKQRLLRDYETNTKTNSYWVTQLSLRYQNNEDIATLFAMDKEYTKITAATIKEAAKRYLNPANLVKVSLFPEKKSTP